VETRTGEAEWRRPLVGPQGLRGTEARVAAQDRVGRAPAAGVRRLRAELGCLCCLTLSYKPSYNPPYNKRTEALSDRGKDLRSASSSRTRALGGRGRCRHYGKEHADYRTRHVGVV
jgi:hypothetical protein